MSEHVGVHNSHSLYLHGILPSSPQYRRASVLCLFISMASWRLLKKWGLMNLPKVRKKKWCQHRGLSWVFVSMASGSPWSPSSVPQISQQPFGLGHLPFFFCAGGWWSCARLVLSWGCVPHGRPCMARMESQGLCLATRLWPGNSCPCLATDNLNPLLTWNCW